jgi:mannose-6-phosphate isomerase-like protein (cupin superfamily)
MFTSGESCPVLPHFFWRADQWWAVQEGEVTFTVKGKAPRLMKAGDYVYVPRGTIHRNQNLSNKPARSIELNITDKDKPQTEQVP